MRKSPCCYCVYKPDEGLKLKLTLKDIFEKTPCANEDCADVLDEYDALEAAYNDAYAECFRAKAERDDYKSRCEALIQVIKSGDVCEYCNGESERCDACGALDGYEFFELDEARFSKGGEGCE